MALNKQFRFDSNAIQVAMSMLSTRETISIASIHLDSGQCLAEIISAVQNADQILEYNR